jgi:hypothetical protein
MVHVNFADINDVQDFEPLPDGDYQCRLADVIEATTKNGHPMWKLKFVVIDGEYAGRYIFDNAVFSEAALPRVKLICGCLGLDVTEAVDLSPEDLLDRRCTVTVYSDEYEDFEGYTKSVNRVPFNGYAFPLETATDSRTSS